MKNKTEVCVPIRNEEELRQAKEMLEKHNEKVDEDTFCLSHENEYDSLYFNKASFDWGLGNPYNKTEIPLSELESVLKGGSKLHICKHCGTETTQPDEECYMVKEIIELKSKKQSSIEWIVDQMQSQQNLHTFDREDWLKTFEQAKQMHREEIEQAVKFGQENSHPASTEFNEVKAKNYYTIKYTVK